MQNSKLKGQALQVAEAMQKNGGYATFAQLNQLLDFSSWSTKTPQASVRRIVQENESFFRVQAGLWALSDAKDEVLKRFDLQTENPQKEEIFSHSYFQGVVVEIGNMKQLQTFVPAQDKNKKFLEKPLREVASLNTIHQFTYPEILRYASTIDVIWFNERRMPDSFYEIEHTTNMLNSISKFFELQDYFSQFRIVAPAHRKDEFSAVLKRSLFSTIRDRIRFCSYDDIANLHSALSRISSHASTI